MRPDTPPCKSCRSVRIWTVAAVGLLLIACQFPSVPSLSVLPASVVPTQHALPYSATIRLADLSAYAVEPGATLKTDPRLQNFIAPAGSVSSLSPEQWEAAVLDYVIARQTFRQVNGKEPTDIVLTLHIFVYIDPGVEFKFNHTYVARTEAVLSDPQSGRALTHYSGLGKAIGPVSRTSPEDDQPPIKKAVRASWNDVFGKIESDARLAQL